MQDGPRSVRVTAPRLALYHHEGCPYCHKVRAAAERLGVPLELRDIRRVASYREELLAARGRPIVPVLRIESGPGRVRWLPESDDIVRWLTRHAAPRIGPGAAPPPPGSSPAGGGRRGNAWLVAIVAGIALAAHWAGCTGFR